LNFPNGFENAIKILFFLQDEMYPGFGQFSLNSAGALLMFSKVNSANPAKLSTKGEKLSKIEKIIVNSLRFKSFGENSKTLSFQRLKLVNLIQTNGVKNRNSWRNLT
jgi:hypothetical protein